MFYPKKKGPKLYMFISQKQQKKLKPIKSKLKWTQLTIDEKLKKKIKIGVFT